MEKEKKENVLIPKMKRLPLGYDDEGNPIMVTIREATMLQMEKTCTIFDELIANFEQDYPENKNKQINFRGIKGDLRLQLELVAVAITNPKKNESDIEYEERLAENLEIVKMAPREHVVECFNTFTEIGNVLNFLTASLFTTMDKIANRLSMMMVASSEALLTSSKSLQQNMVGQDGKSSVKPQHS